PPPARASPAKWAEAAGGRLDTGLRALPGYAGEEVLGDAVGLGDDYLGLVRLHRLARGFGEELQPAAEVRGVEREAQVLHHRIAFIAAGRVQHRRPEVLEQGEVPGPVVD